MINTNDIKGFIKGILNSYSQIFFSDNKIFAAILLIVSFFDVYAGLSGLMAILVSNSLAFGLGYNRINTIKGSYGFNSLLVGLGTGLLYQPGFELFIIVFIISVLTFFITVTLEGVLGKYGLPFLSIPFLFGLWIIVLSGYDFGALGVSERGLYKANELYLIGGQNLVDLYNWWNDLNFADSINVYFLSLGAIFFQYNVLSGILIAIGVLIYSRIAFTLSLLGFFTAYYFYQLIGADITTLSYNYIGFNFILTSIALGGFFVVPSRYSYLWIVLLLPIVVLMTLSLNRVFITFNLSIYSLPFNIIVLLFLYSLKLRINRNNRLSEVLVQQYSPEKNLYFHKNASERFLEQQFFPVSLPFWGDWTVMQGHNGEYTHKGDWQQAWDFVIEDENKKQFSGDGIKVSDYYCYNKKVLAPSAGIIAEIADGIDDNEIGDVNINQNWGNSIIIKHTEHLYSQLSHLKPNSIKVSKGEYVKKGQVLAVCGNSGRSPYPHIHFQMQATPFIGSETLDYPVSHYIHKTKSGFKLKSFDKPKTGDIVSNIQTNELLKNALHFIPGQILKFTCENNNEEVDVHWEIKTDVYNNSYIHCEKSNSFAYFYNDGTIHYFKNFVGNRNSYLFKFYIALYKVQTGYYKDLEMTDSFPVNQTFRGGLLFLQDFVAPFFFFLKSKYSIRYESLDNELSPSQAKLRSVIKKYIFSKEVGNMDFQILIDRKGIKSIVFSEGNKKGEERCKRKN